MFVFNSQLIKQRLEEKGFSQAKFGNEVGLNPASVTRMLQNKQKNIDLETACRICDLLNIEIGELIINDTPKPDIITFDEIMESSFRLSNIIARYKSEQGCRDGR